MRKTLVALVGLIVALAAATPASANKRCPPLPVQGTGSPTCKCAVQNYSTVPDTAINIVIYDSAGGLHSCNGVTLGPRMGTYCHVSILPGTTCGCVVSGEGSSTLASLSVTEPSTVGPQVSVACQ